MPSHGNDSTVLKTFIKKSKKLVNSFTEEVLTLELPILESSLTNERKEIDFKKFYPSEEYYDQLVAYLFIKSIKNANKIYNVFQVKYERENPNSNKNKQIKEKKKIILPKGWRVINGFKS